MQEAGRMRGRYEPRRSPILVLAEPRSRAQKEDGAIVKFSGTKFSDTSESVGSRKNFVVPQAKGEERLENQDASIVLLSSSFKL